MAIDINGCFDDMEICKTDLRESYGFNDTQIAELESNILAIVNGENSPLNDCIFAKINIGFACWINQSFPADCECISCSTFCLASDAQTYKEACELFCLAKRGSVKETTLITRGTVKHDNATSVREFQLDSTTSILNATATSYQQFSTNLPTQHIDYIHWIVQNCAAIAIITLAIIAIASISIVYCIWAYKRRHGMQ